MMNRRGQAAMEYLMTYGWALLVIVLVLGALLYLGVLNPQSRLQDMCKLPVGWDCKVVALSNNGNLMLTITNYLGIPVNASVACVQGTGADTSTLTYSSIKTLLEGEAKDFNCTIDKFTGQQIGDSSSGEVFVKYKELSGGVDKYIKGTYIAKVSTIQK